MNVITDPKISAKYQTTVNGRHRLSTGSLVQEAIQTITAGIRSAEEIRGEKPYGNEAYNILARHYACRILYNVSAKHDFLMGAHVPEFLIQLESVQLPHDRKELIERIQLAHQDISKMVQSVKSSSYMGSNYEESTQAELLAHGDAIAEVSSRLMTDAVQSLSNKKFVDSALSGTGCRAGRG